MLEFVTRDSYSHINYIEMDKNLFMHLNYDRIIATQINVYFSKLVIYISKKNSVKFSSFTFEEKKIIKTKTADKY
jgi:hypothetical protein